MKENEKILSETNCATLFHIKRVASLLTDMAYYLMFMAKNHDESKLVEPEYSTFTKYTPLLKTVEYGSEEYKKFLDEMNPALKHHYECNKHHPEHFATGINGMSLLNIIEMLCDWIASSERMKDGGDIMKSIEIGSERFGIDIQLKTILINTIIEGFPEKYYKEKE
jgi:hypothetical protein